MLSAWSHPSVALKLQTLAATWHFRTRFVITDEDDKSDAFAAMEVAIACSGTVTTELAAQGAADRCRLPARLGNLGHRSRILMRGPFITLLNVAAEAKWRPNSSRPGLRCECGAKRSTGFFPIPRRWRGSARTRTQRSRKWRARKARRFYCGRNVLAFWPRRSQLAGYLR